MALNTYITQTQQFLQNPVPASQPLVSDAVVTGYVNQARRQIAGEAECIPGYLTLAVTAAAQQYPFTSISLANAPTGCSGVFHVKQASWVLGSGAVYIPARSFTWLNQYYLMNPTPTAGAPSVYAQYGQGEAGTLFFNLLDADYTINLDCICVPDNLLTDGDTEALPYPWTDCVAFLGAYFALLSMQRTTDADQMYSRYEQFMSRARRMSTPATLPYQSPQVSDPTTANKLGLRTGGGGK